MSIHWSYDSGIPQCAKKNNNRIKKSTKLDSVSYWDTPFMMTLSTWNAQIIVNKKNILLIKRKTKIIITFGHQMDFFFYEFHFSFCRIRSVAANSQPLIFISTMAIDKLLAIKLIAKTNVSNSMWIVNINIMNIRYT